MTFRIGIRCPERQPCGLQVRLVRPSNNRRVLQFIAQLDQESTESFHGHNLSHNWTLPGHSLLFCSRLVRRLSSHWKSPRSSSISTSVYKYSGILPSNLNNTPGAFRFAKANSLFTYTYPHTY